MRKSWEDIVINWDGDEIPLLRLVALWLEEDTDVTYRNLKGIEAHLITHDFDIPEAIAERLENSAHKKRHKGEKKDIWKKDIRDLGIYLEKQSTPIPHGQSERFIAEKADELGLEDEMYLAERVRAIGKFFEQDLSPNTIYLDYNLYLKEAYGKRHIGREAERYALRLVAQKYHASQATIKKLLK
jgi:hypothetical protein